VADHEEIGDVTDVSEVEDDGFVGFLVQGGVDAVGDLRGQVRTQKLSSSMYNSLSRIYRATRGGTRPARPSPRATRARISLEEIGIGGSFRR
jgi:hypothetical protein